MGDRDAELLSIGSELLLGETVDTNAAFLGAELASIGLRLRLVRQLPDEIGIIADAFGEARRRSAVVLATGGLGPTHDDLTRDGLAGSLGEPLTEDPALRGELEERFRAYGRMPASNLRQAMIIPSAEILPNPIGSAPGWWVEGDGSVTVLLPGVPAEMRRMWTEEVRPRLARRFELPPLTIRTVKAFGIGESMAAERLGGLIEAPPHGVEAGIYARDDGVHVRFSTAGDPGVLDDPVAAALEALGDDAYGTDDDDLASAVLHHSAGAAWPPSPAGRPIPAVRSSPSSPPRHPPRVRRGSSEGCSMPAAPRARRSPTSCSSCPCRRRTAMAAAG
jgi:nicotinamide-nucleotide amidase